MTTHECTLPNAKQHIINDYIQSGIWINLRRKLKRFCMVNSNHPNCRVYYRSEESRKAEEKRHLLSYPHMIHPCSMAAISFDIFRWLVYLICLVLVPTDLAFRREISSVAISITYFSVNFLHINVIIITFFIGYYDSNENKSIMDFKHISKKYLKTYFFPEAISITPSLLKILVKLGLMKFTDNLKIVMRVINCLKAVRCFTWYNLIDRLRHYFKMPVYLYRGIALFLLYFLVWYWSSCMIYGLLRYDELKTVYPSPILKYLYSATQQFLLIHSGSVPPRSIIELWIFILSICSGFIFQLYLYGAIMQLWMIKYSNSSNRNDLLENMSKQYLRHKRLSTDLRERVRCFTDFCYQGNMHDHKKVTKTISRSLFKDVLLYIYQNVLTKVEMLKDLPPLLQLDLLTHFIVKVYLPNDYIIRRNERPEYAVVVIFGTVAVYSNTGKEISHLEDNSCFNDFALVFDSNRAGSLKAVTACEVVIIRKSDFLAAITKHEELEHHIIEDARLRYLAKYK